ncbi:MAG: hypothetical protein P9M12_02035 [Candidatus Aceula lacicola]|nr:hypothetical protein [Candidatus Aceula lacicola]
MFIISPLSFGQTLSEYDIVKSVLSDESTEKGFYTLKDQAKIFLEQNRRISKENNSLKKKKLVLIEELRILSSKRKNIQKKPLKKEEITKKFKKRIKDLHAAIKNIEDQVFLSNARSIDDQEWVFKLEKENADLKKTFYDLSQQKVQAANMVHSQPRADTRDFNKSLDQLKKVLLKSQNEFNQAQKEFNEKQKLSTAIYDLENSIEDLNQRPEREHFEKDQRVMALQQDIAELKEKIVQRQKEQEEMICVEEDKLLVRVEDLKVKNISLSNQVFGLNIQVQNTKKEKESLAGILSTTGGMSSSQKVSKDEICKDISCDRPNNIVLPKTLFKVPEILK